MSQTSPIIFDGYAYANEKLVQLQPSVEQLAGQGRQLKIAAIVFKEDEGSLLYTDLKAKAAEILGIGYDRFLFSLKNHNLAEVEEKIKDLNKNPLVTGIIIQKPWKKTWQQFQSVDQAVDFSDWWEQLVSSLDVKKDVDGLHPETQAAIEAGTWMKQGLVLPATAKAVLVILDVAENKINFSRQKGESIFDLAHKKIVIIGRSNLLGIPVFNVLKNWNYDVEMIGKQGLEQRIEQQIYLQDADVVITATGRTKLITGKMVKQGSVLIDVGEPQPDFEFDSVKEKALFITPVPGGVGPLTVISLMENCVKLGQG
jgi:methylenetetrahydrofolate dehydrogenase (NADP+) / methenyltetrahydrofolate cyclohydrolase